MSAPLAPIEVVAAVIIRDGKFLLARRKGCDLDGLWEFPGGKLEEGETFACAAIREIREELSVEIVPHERLLILEHEYPKKRVRLHFVRCDLPEGQTMICETEAAWHDPESASHLQLCPADRVAFRNLEWPVLLTEKKHAKGKG